MALLAINGTALAPDPSALTWGLQDISAADAGRVHDSGNTMYKMRTSQKRKLNCTWTLITAAQASTILNAVNPEYFSATYFDLLANAYQTRTFYVGDRSAPFKWVGLDGKGTRVGTLTFDLIER